MCEPCRTCNISVITWNGKLNLPFEENAQLRDDYLKLKRIWRSEVGNRKVQKWHFMRLIENSNLKDCNYIKRINELVRLRERRSAYELEMRNRLFNESRTRSCQEVEELRRICCEDTDRARQARIDELSIHQEKCYNCESAPDSKVRIYRTMYILCQMQENFTILGQRGTLERPTVPFNPCLFRVPEECPAAILDCRTIRNIVGTSGTFLKGPPAREGPPSAVFENFKNLESSSQELRPDIPGNCKATGN